MQLMASLLKKSLMANVLLRGFVGHQSRGASFHDGHNRVSQRCDRAHPSCRAKVLISTDQSESDWRLVGMIINPPSLPNPVIPPDMPTSDILARLEHSAPHAPRSVFDELIHSSWFPFAGALLVLGALAALVFSLPARNPYRSRIWLH
jgi:hypothetical protein